MHKNNFCTIPSKASKYKDSITISQSTIYKNNDEGLKHNKNIKKLKKVFIIMILNASNLILWNVIVAFSLIKIIFYPKKFLQNIILQNYPI